MKKYKLLKDLPLHLMMLPGMLLVLLFCYKPMIGIVMSFQNFSPRKGIFGSKWVGLDNFRYLADIPDIEKVIWNTFFIALLKLVLGVVIPVIVALMLNELRKKFLKKSIQTIIYFPHFLSWVILSGIFIDVLSPSTGILNNFLNSIGIDSIFFLGDPKWFPYTMAITETWKEFGFGTIVYLAAIVGIDPTLYEAASVDGAGRWRQTLVVTLPAVMPIATLMLILNMGSVLNLSFEQIYNLYSPQVYATGDILDTLVYRLGMHDAQYGVATAVGLFKSLVSTVLVILSYKLANKTSDYRIF